MDVEIKEWERKRDVIFKFTSELQTNNSLLLLLLFLTFFRFQVTESLFFHTQENVMYQKKEIERKGSQER